MGNGDSNDTTSSTSETAAHDSASCRRHPRPKVGMRPGAALIARPSLVERLIESDAPLVVICAPAGYGKTTLVRQWAEEDERPFAWLKPSDDDNDQELLAEHLTRALFAAGVIRNRPLQPSLTLARQGVGTTQTDLAAIVSVSGARCNCSR